MTPTPLTSGIARQGAEIVGELKTQPWGLRGFTVRDPDGNLIDVAQQIHGPSGRSEYRDLAASSLPGG
jgi:Glyoxalase/Bleomycin resistance protein/Dioxygenase superfamily